MNEQEQIMLEFIEWLPKNIKEFSSAKSSDEVVAMLNDIQKSENGEMKLKELFSAFQKSKQNIPMAQHGSKIDYFVKKFETGGPAKINVPVHEKWNRTPWDLSFMAANLSGKKVELPMRPGTTVRRTMVRVKNPHTGMIMDRIHREDGNGNTYRIITPSRDTVYEYNERQYHKGDEMYDRYEKAWKQYGIYKKGGKLDLSIFRNKK